jgi:hypothetical protein
VYGEDKQKYLVCFGAVHPSIVTRRCLPMWKRNKNKKQKANENFMKLDKEHKKEMCAEND